VSVRRYWIFACVLALAVGLSACGRKAHPTVADADNNGFYVDAGQVTYQLEVSRQLNQYSTEDSQYLAGLPAGTVKTKPDELWYGVFLWAKNQSNTSQVTARNFEIVDTQGNKYFPVALNPALNPYAWKSMTLAPSSTEPGLDTTANTGPTQGALLLFKLNTAVYSNRPLTLQIDPPGAGQPSTISLDL
jgi:hypothetical protein